MKNIFVFLALFSHLSVASDRFCCVDPDLKPGFCKSLDYDGCMFFIQKCGWVYPCPSQYDDSPPRVIVTPPREGYIGTGMNEDGGSDITYLDRHHVNCGDKAISVFKLFRPTESSIAYEYKCGTTSMGNVRATTTPANDRGYVFYLDRHHVDCGNNALLGFKLVRPTDSKIAYDYTCGSLPMKNIRSEKTAANTDGGGGIIYLDRHDVNCGSDALLGFRLYRPSPGMIAYEYTCGN